MTPKGRVSVIVPSYNQARWLPATLASIEAQGAVVAETLVLDGGSTDGTVEYLQSLGSRPGLWWRSRRDGGVAQAVNEGLQRATSPLCAIQSSDDEYTPGALEAAVGALESRPDAAVAYADAQYIDADGQLVGRTNVGAYGYDDLLMKRTFVMQSSAVFRTEAAREVGGFRPQHGYVCDSEMWLRIGRRYPLVRVEGVWSRYRVHGEQRDAQAERIQREWWAMIESLRPELSAREWRHARVGAYLTEHRYGDRFGWRRACALWRALALKPSALGWPEFPRGDLLLPVRWVGSRVLRGLGLRSRPGPVGGAPPPIGGAA